MVWCTEWWYRFSKLIKSLSLFPLQKSPKTLQSSVGQLIFNFIQVSSPSFYPPVGSDAQTSLRGFLQLAPPLCTLSFFSSPLSHPTAFWSSDSWSHMENFAPWRWRSVCCSPPTFQQLHINVAEGETIFFFLVKANHSAFLGRLTVN